jgi:hypothetical protein
MRHSTVGQSGVVIRDAKAAFLAENPWASLGALPNPAYAANERFGIYSMAELAKLPRPEFLIDGLLPSRGLSVVYGKEGSGKSFLTLDWALCLAHGRPWANLPVKQTRVIYVAAEGAYGYPSRIAAWHKATKLDPEQAASEIFFLDEPVHLTDSRNDLDEFVAKVEQRRLRPGLMIFDTLSRCLAGEDENSAKVMSAAVERVEKIGNRFQCGVILVHHARRLDQEIRGSSSLPGAANMMCSVAQHRGKDTRLMVKCSKMKDGPQFDDTALHFSSCADSIVLSLASRNTPRGANDDQLSPTKQKLLDILPADGLTKSEWAKLAASRKIPASSAYRTIDSLERGGFVRVESNRYLP